LTYITSDLHKQRKLIGKSLSCKDSQVQLHRFIDLPEFVEDFLVLQAIQIVSCASFQPMIQETDQGTCVEKCAGLQTFHHFENKNGDQIGLIKQ
jgi:hypothetical protein